MVDLKRSSTLECFDLISARFECWIYSCSPRCHHLVFTLSTASTTLSTVRGTTVVENNRTAIEKPYIKLQRMSYFPLSKPVNEVRKNLFVKVLTLSSRHDHLPASLQVSLSKMEQTQAHCTSPDTCNGRMMGVPRRAVKVREGISGQSFNSGHGISLPSHSRL